MYSSLLVGSYFHLGNPFLWLHAAVWVLALGIFRVLARRVKDADKNLDSHALTEADLRTVTVPITSLEHHLEVCAAGFVLIGLLGTMASFVSAMPGLSSDDSNLAGFAAALSTSAFGLCWSLLLTFAMSAYRGLRIEPVLHKLNHLLKMEQIAEILAHSISTFGDKVVGDLRNGTEKFAHASMEMAIASNRLSQVTRTAGDSWEKAMHGSVATAARLNAAFDRAVDLPNDLAARLTVIFDSVAKHVEENGRRLREEQERRSQAAATAFSDTFVKALVKLESLPEQVGKAIGEQSTRYAQALDASSHASVERLKLLVQELHDTNKAATERELAAYLAATSQATAQGIAEVRAVVVELDKTMARVAHVAREVKASNLEIAKALTTAADTASKSTDALRTAQERTKQERSANERSTQERSASKASRVNPEPSRDQSEPVTKVGWRKRIFGG